ncbi:hypothetical protein ACQ4PT_049022 [Festuca glaucescens]
MPPWIFSRKGASGFSWASTADQVTQGLSAAGLTAIVTGNAPPLPPSFLFPLLPPFISIRFVPTSGASSGIGAETARVLAARGAHVVMAARNLAAAESVRQAVLADTPAATLDVMELDLSSMASVRKFAADFNAKGLPLNILVNNAGVMATPFTLSKDGIEMQFATNHVGHFLLTNLLLETMKKTARESNVEGRIVNVSSEVHRFTYKEGIRFDKINDEAEYGTFGAYGQSKLANILHANELARRFKGAATTCYVALHPGAKGVSGKYFSDSNVYEASEKAKDVELAKKLWDFSVELTT